MFNFLKFTIMMILIGIILIFLGIGFYSTANRNDITNEWMCMLGFLTMMSGALMIGISMDGTM